MMAAPSLRAALQQAARCGVDRLDAQLLLGRLLSRPRTWLLAHDEHPLDTAQAAAWTTILARRAAGEPLAYLLGDKEFYGLTLQVGPAVLVPRPETETLVDWGLEHIASIHAGRPATAARVLDLGTGSGAIALAIKQNAPDADVAAVDASAAALAVAAANGRRLGLPVEWLQGDWWTPVAGRHFDVIVSNPPYVATGDPHLVALGHEPIEALVSGADGFDALRAIVGAGRQHLRHGGYLLLEHGHDQGEAVADLFRAQRYDRIEHRQDLAGHTRCTGAARGEP